jgi:hypothetical protein
MTGERVMQWYVRQFLKGNYSFALPNEEALEAGKKGG